MEEIRKCAQCSNAYIARRPQSRFCSAKCRVARSRGTEPVDSGGRAQVPPTQHGRLFRSTMNTLMSVEREETPLGVVALLLAKQIDSGAASTALAPLMREYRSALAEAMRGVAVDSSVDELRRRRDELRRGAG